MTNEQELQYFLSLLPSALPDNPSQSGWSAGQIKEQYSKAPMFLYNRIKEIEEVVSETSSFFADGVALKAVADEDGNNIRATYFAAVTEINGSHSGTYQKRYYRFTNKLGEQAGLLIVNLDLATTSYAGLMSASDKQKVNDVDSKINKSSNPNIVYATDDDGSQTTISVDDFVTGAIVRRTDTTSGNIYVGVPTADNHAARKKYVDDNAGHSLTISGGSGTNYVYTLTLKSGSNQTLSTIDFDLPIENVVVGGSYNNSTKKVVLTLDNGNTIEFSVADLVSGLLSESAVSVTGGYVSSISKGGNVYQVAQNVAVNTVPKIVQSTTDLPETNDGFMYLVLDDGYLYYYDEGWEQGYEYIADPFTFATNTEVENLFA